MTDTAPDDALTMSWIVARALEGTVEPLILSGLCDRLNTTGMALTRAVIAGDLLDPQLGARGVRWERSGGGGRADLRAARTRRARRRLDRQPVPRAGHLGRANDAAPAGE